MHKSSKLTSNLSPLAIFHNILGGTNGCGSPGGKSGQGYQQDGGALLPIIHSFHKSVKIQFLLFGEPVVQGFEIVGV